MKPSKHLELRRDAMTDLATDEMRGLAGGNALTPQCPTLQVKCPSDPVTGCTVIQETRDCLDTFTCPTDIC